MSKYVLIVDDNPSDQLIAKTFLENEGMIVKVMNNGIDALNFLNEEEVLPHLLIIDLQMPQMPGLELIKRIRRIEKFQKTPVLIMSARQEVKDVKLAIELGASDYSIKPIDGLVFSKKVKKLTENIDDNWAEYKLTAEDENFGCRIQQMAKLLSISETGITITSSTKLDPGETTSFEAEVFEEIGLEMTPVTKVSTCTESQGVYTIKLNFVGLPEKQAKLIRQYCRKKWAQGRQNQDLKIDSKQNVGGRHEKGLSR